MVREISLLRYMLTRVIAINRIRLALLSWLCGLVVGVWIGCGCVGWLLACGLVVVVWVGCGFEIETNHDDHNKPPQPQ